MQDKPGVLANVTQILADEKISIDALIQKEPGDGEEEADLVLLTHLIREKYINLAIAKIEELSVVVGQVTRIRMEELSK